MKFGIGQISNPTPAVIAKWVRGITVVSAFFIGWMATATIMGPHTKDIVNQIIALVVGLVNVLAPLFGVPVSGKVLAEDVKVIDKT